MFRVYIIFLALLITPVCPTPAQVFSVAPDAPNSSQSPDVQAPSGGQQLGWGSNIQNARLARAAELALEHGDRALAVDYAQRAAQAAPGDPQLWFLLGYTARIAARFELSAEAYRQGLRLNPASHDGLSGLAQTYSVMGRSDEAEPILKQLLAHNPWRREDAVLLGELYMRSGDYPNALEWLGRAEHREPAPRSELLMALTYQRLKQMDLARRYLDMAKRHAPDEPDVQRSLAGYYREVGDYAQAIAALTSVAHPNPDVKGELAYTYQLDGKLKDSARMYVEAAASLPRDLGVQLSAAQAQVAIGSIERASEFVQRATAINPDYYRLHVIRGEIARLEERDRDAVREYSAALASLPESPIEGPLFGIQLHMDLMQLYENLKNPDAARSQLEIAQAAIGALDEQGSGRASFLRLRALIKMNTGQLGSALGDITEALSLNARDSSSLQLEGDLLIRLGRTAEAIATYKRILVIDPVNRFALTSLGYASRLVGDDREAEKYFQRLARADPSLYVPYLALGDLYTARGDLTTAQIAYSKAYALAPRKPLIVAGGMNAAIEAHKLALAETWLSRATEEMQQEPQVLLEKERYLSFKGEYQRSADVGREVIKVLPNDRDGVVYLGYDLLNLHDYNQLLTLTSEYNDLLPKEPDIPLLAGYVHKHEGQLVLARMDFTEVLKRNPEVVTAYVNLGYVLNDLHQPQPAAAAFEAALKREPKNGEAHLGLAFSDLDLKEPQAALRHAQFAESAMGDSEPIHLIRATAYGREGMLQRAIIEYRAALRFSPRDGSLYLGMGNALFAERRYHDAINQLLIAEKLSPRDPVVYAILARAFANVQDREQSLRYVQLAELHAEQTPAVSSYDNLVRSGIYVSTGEALNTLGDQNAAMERFRKALITPDADRVSVRLAVATLMTQQSREDDASRQIALALMEAQAGETTPVTGNQFVEAADVFRNMHEYHLSQAYLQRAKTAGATDMSVHVGLANNYLALGDTARARGELAAVKRSADNELNYQYLLAEANVFRQEHRGAQALTAFAQANDASGEDQSVEQSLLAAGADEGLRVVPSASFLSNVSLDPIFEDTTVYVLDSKLDTTFPVPPSQPSLLPPPRSSLQTQGTAAYHLHLGDMPTASGFFQVRNAQGQISVPSTNSIVNRNTTDYSLSFGLNPTVHLGTNVLTFNSGVQGTIRRDSESPVQMNQNLFRVFTYVSTSSFFNLVAASAYVLRESGPFTESNLSSHTLTGAVDFRVGEPWGKTALITGWGDTDQTFSPDGYKNHYTSSYAGLERRFFDRLNVRAVAEYLRAWRIVEPNSGIAQNLRPAGSVDFALTRNWDLQASTAYSSNRGFHVYDATQYGFSISYTRPFHRKFNDESGEVTLQYPIRISGGLQAETFFNFPGGHNQQLRPYVSLTLF
jgi:predicted Zn-dependent protease